MADPRMIVCPHCGSTNRVAGDKSLAEGKCGKCHEPLFDGQPTNVNAAAFDKQITRSDVPVVVDFWADWCGPCQMMAPEFAKAAVKAAGTAILVKVNTDERQDIASQFRVQGIPAFALIKNGKVAAQTSGFQPADRLLAWMRNN